MGMCLPMPMKFDFAFLECEDSTNVTQVNQLIIRGLVKTVGYIPSLDTVDSSPKHFLAMNQPRGMKPWMQAFFICLLSLSMTFTVHKFSSVCLPILKERYTGEKPEVSKYACLVVYGGGLFNFLIKPVTLYFDVIAWQSIDGREQYELKILATIGLFLPIALALMPLTVPDISVVYIIEANDEREYDTEMELPIWKSISYRILLVLTTYSGTTGLLSLQDDYRMTAPAKSYWAST